MKDGAGSRLITEHHADFTGVTKVFHRYVIIKQRLKHSSGKFLARFCRGLEAAGDNADYDVIMLVIRIVMPGNDIRTFDAEAVKILIYNTVSI